VFLSDAQQHGDLFSSEEVAVFGGYHRPEVDVREDHLRFSSTLVVPFDVCVLLDKVAVGDVLQEGLVLHCR